MSIHSIYAGSMFLLLVMITKCFAADSKQNSPVVYATIAIGKKQFAYDIHFSPDGKSLAYIEGARGGDRIVLWNVDKKEKIIAFDSEKNFRQLVWSPNGKYVYASDLVTIVKIDVANGDRIKLYGHDNAITALKYQTENNHLISGGMDGTIIVWDTTNDKMVKSFKCPKDAIIIDAQPVPTTSRIVITTTFGVTRTQGKKSIIDVQFATFLVDVSDGSFTEVLDKASVCDGSRQLASAHTTGEFAFADSKKTVYVSHASTGKSRLITDCVLSPFCCSFSPNDRYLFVGGFSKDRKAFDRTGALAIYDLVDEKWIALIETATPASNISYSSEKNLLTYASITDASANIIIWDIQEPAVQKLNRKDKR